MKENNELSANLPTINVDMKANNLSDVIVVEQSAHLPINIKPTVNRYVDSKDDTYEVVTNGPNNSNWQTYIDAFDDSPTNSSIIKGTVNYIFADGLIDLNGETEIAKEFNVSKHLSNQHAKLICMDYKKFGGFAVQVIWNNIEYDPEKPQDKKPLQVKYFKIFKLALSLNDEGEVNGYIHCFDWSNPSKYKSKFYPMYTGEYKGNDVEMIIFQQPTSNDYWAQPDYISGLRYAQIQGNLQDWSNNHILNGFQGTVLLNVNGGKPASQELEYKFKKDILSKLTGTNNANKVIISFNKNKDQAIDVVHIPITELNDQYVQFSTDAREMLIEAHQASPIIFANTKDGGGLSNNADEIEMATKMTYRKVIRPMQKDILSHLQTIFKDIENEVGKDENGNPIYKTIQLGFKDFESFSGDNRKDIQK